MTFLLIYLLLDISFVISSYFFIHLESFKLHKRKSTWKDGLGYITAAFLIFPLLVYAWYFGKEILLQIYGEKNE
ncbi:MAG: hypothetical protein GY707_05630 [Desulfobacteraceae bacterium]|nr:hypothetical protein [Desulfobacteraceae bacterium]